MGLSPGDRLGPYEVVSPLGRGGMGEVYQGRDPRIGRDVAIKVLPESFTNDRERLARFEREARSAGVLNHPNVVVVYDVGERDGSPYIVSELLEGQTLRERLSEGPVPVGTAVDYAGQIARGLSAAHDKGIVHRDLKPENIFITRDDRVKILDFGLAKLTQRERAGTDVTEASTLTAGTDAGVALGTVGYMSPEQVRGLPADSRSDIFSFGAVLYEMLSGRRAFRSGSHVETMNAILKEDPPPLDQGRGALSSALERVVRRCLEKEPAKRFQSASDVPFALVEASTPLAVALPGSRPALPRRLILAAGAVMALATAILLWRRLPPSAPSVAGTRPRFSSLAVLPLANFSGDKEQEYFSDGMTEALISDLAQVSALRVISRTSVMQYKGTRKALRQIAAELGVDAVIEGSVMRAGDRVRITAQLIDGKTDQHLWAHDYQRDLRDVLALQADVARSIAQAVRATLTPREEAKLATVRPIDPSAQEAYLKGRYFLGEGTEDSIVKAIGYFRRSIEKDPLGARGYAGLADAYSGLRSIYRSPHQVMPQAKAAAVKAVELDESLAEGHVSLGFVRMFYDFDWKASETEFRRAIDLNPSLADAHDGLALFLMANDRHAEASEEIERARQLDPLSPIVLGDASWVYYGARRYDRALELARQWVELEPNSPWSHTYLGLALEKTGHVDEAIHELETAAAHDRSVTILEWLGSAYAAAGRTADARRILAELTGRAEKRYVCPYEIATVYAGLGEKDAAFQWLQKGIEERADCMPWIRADSKLDVLRSDPRFAGILRGVGFPARAQ
jgi:serine/threonine protein kinase/tetratricopeptide (TPR) repeat protein